LFRRKISPRCTCEVRHRHRRARSDVPTIGANGDVTERLDVEGADLLLLAGVNDSNLNELSRQTGVRVALRGDVLSLIGPADAVERATAVARRMIDAARQRMTLDADDVLRIALAGGTEPSAPSGMDDGRIALPGVRRVIQPKTPGQRAYVERIADHDIVVGIGPAGTGKTYLAVAAAVDALARKRVRRIILARPAVEAGENLGFLPGDMQAKVDPYLRPLYDALEDMMPAERMQRALETRTIEIAPLAYMRGRTLSDAFVILDEAQNATPAQMKMFLTRLGVNSRTVITGDKTQIDLPRPDESGLLQIERILPGIEGIAFHYFTDADVVRHRLVRQIIKAYASDASS
jgi:phosphate starvation-inducible PhoH-like protein